MNPQDLSRILAASRQPHGGRRAAKRVLREVTGGHATGAELDAVLAQIHSHPSRDAIEAGAAAILAQQSRETQAHPKLPRWLIDDTADLGEARVFVAHTHKPRFFGEVLPEGDEDVSGVTLSGVLNEQVLCRICWIDPASFDPDELLDSLNEALAAHDAVRSLEDRS